MKGRLEDIRQAVVSIASKPRTIAQWAGMADELSEFFRFKIADCAEDILHDEIFRRAIGYLSLSPKEVVEAGKSRGDFLSATEIEKLDRHFHEMLVDLEEWLARNAYDEDMRFPDESRAPAERKVLLLVKRALANEFKLTKQITRGTLFCSVFFDSLAKVLPENPILPRQAEAMPADADGEMSQELIDKRETREFREKVLTGMSAIVTDALSDSAAHRRAGTAGEQAQEDEVIRRVKAGLYGTLSAAVAGVLRDRNFAQPDGYPNTPAGRAKCYNRVYALLHPLRRRRKS